MADFLVDHPVHDNWELNDDLPGEEVFFVNILLPREMYCDGAARRDSVGAGVVFISFENHILLYSFVLIQLCSSNVVEYQALSLGLQTTIEMGITNLNIYGDSQLVINQPLDEYKVRKEDLVLFITIARKVGNSQVKARAKE